MSGESTRPTPVARGKRDNSLDTCPTLYGLRLQQFVPVFDAKRTETMRVYQAEPKDMPAEKAYTETRNVAALYGPKGEPKKKPSSGAGPPYENGFYDLGRGTEHRFTLDILNAADGHSKYNSKLRKRVKVAPARAGTWKVVDTGNFYPESSVKATGEVLATEELLLVFHLYLRKGGSVYALDKETKPWSLVSGKDATKDYEKWRDMGSGRPSKASENVLQPGVNHVVVVLRPTDETDAEAPLGVEEVYLDGDLMVLDDIG